MSPTGSAVVVLAVLASLLAAIPATSPARVNLSDYDLVLLTLPTPSERQSVVLVSVGGVTTKTLIPPPPPPIANEDSSDSMSSEYRSLAVDPSTDSVYLGSQTTINVFNVRENETQPLYSSAGDEVEANEITDLVFSNSTLYWIESQKTVRAMRLDDEENNAKVDTLVTVPKDSTDTIHGLAVDKRSGTVYFGKWLTHSRLDSTINYYAPGNGTTGVLMTKVQLPRSLEIDGDQLYWVNKPPGIYFTIERALTSDPSSTRNVVVKQAYQHASSIAVKDRTLYWTDAGDNRLYVVQGTSTWSHAMDVQAGKFASVVSVPSSHQRHAEQLNMPILTKAVVDKELRNGKLEGTTTLLPSSSGDVVSIRTTVPTTISPSTEDLRSRTTVQITTTMPSERTTVLRARMESLEYSSEPEIRVCSEHEAESIECPTAAHHVCVVLRHTSEPTCLSSAHLSSSDERTSNIISSGAWPPQLIALVSVLATLATVMTLLSMYLTLRVRSLSRKPIIRRRLVVSRRTSESSNSLQQQQQPASVCEMIDIENCCNMNVCETPCYERTLLNPGGDCSSSSQQQPQISVNSTNGASWPAPKDDRKCLLR